MAPSSSESTAFAGEDVVATLRERGFIQQTTDEAAITQALRMGPVTIYSGFDPTADSLHVGHMLPLLAMAHLARHGHRPIAVLGVGTAMVGDPSGKTEMRQLLTAEAIAHNVARIEVQIKHLLADAANALVVHNGEWLLSLRYFDFLRDIGRHFSVNRMLTAETYKMRLETGLSFIEFNYQLLQAYDFLVLFRRYGCTLQVGGDDQWSNILAGADLIRRLERKEAFGLTLPLLTNAAGAKMGKTAAGAVWLSPERTSPFDFYQYWVNTDDRDVERFLKLFTFMPLAEIQRYAQLHGSEIRQAKQALAFEVTRMVHGKEAAEAAQNGAAAAFGGGGGSELVPTHEVATADLNAGIKLVDLLAQCGLAASKSAARRLVSQGGVRFGDAKVTDVELMVRLDDVPADGLLLHAGKKHLRRIVASK